MMDLWGKYKGYQSISTDEDCDVERVTPEFANSKKPSLVEKFCKGRTPIMILLFAMSLVILIGIQSSQQPLPTFKAAWSSRAAPFSVADPTTLGFTAYDRPFAKPGPIFGKLLSAEIPLPTNSWYENFFLGGSTNTDQNIVFQVPYILDTGGHIAGVRTHPCHVQADAREIMVSKFSIDLHRF